MFECEQYPANQDGITSYGSYSGGGQENCCPPVADTKTVITLMAFILLAAYYLSQYIIPKSKLGRRRKREPMNYLIWAGKFFNRSNNK